MESKIVRQYFTQDLTSEEKKSYLDYINGNESSNEWIEKASVRREPLLLMELQCNLQNEELPCGAWVSIRENGICKCSNGHDCYNVVIPAIKKIMEI
jgi:hypothetical protein